MTLTEKPKLPSSSSSRFTSVPLPTPAGPDTTSSIPFCDAIPFSSPVRGAYSTFCTCSRSFSISDFMSTTAWASMASLALEPMVFASRFIS